MTPGPTLVLACPHCDHLARLVTYAATNTVGARYWTDGRMIAPLQPDVPVLGCCAGCGGYFWVDDAREIGQVAGGAGEMPREWREAEVLGPLAAEAWLAALSAGAGDTAEREITLRLHAWWAANDRFRADDAPPGVDDPRFGDAMVENLRRLDALIALDDAEHRLLKAEIARELGHFAGAEALLIDPVGDDHYQPVADLLRRLSEREVRLVRELGRGSD